ncbi:MAG: deoxynucleoside kinase [Ignavibacteria bacterium]|jgi:deoxyadenosine/deoxycytidine kinase|nr:deoxynucleoside kinase [Ignavibacteria bacterium]MDH7527429.1 deoxynucleoside kinase [Ignavibacteria bacterium]NPV12122.1 deoxynucleoside kinase [Ignavibacteria bacterium]
MTEKNKRKELQYIAIEGVIGAGKTTLATLLSERLNADLVLEQFEINPFLEKFYKDRRRYAFQTQIFFLVNRYIQQQNLLQANLFKQYLVSDYIFEKDRIFASINLEGDELKLYETLASQLEKNILKPDLVIYLQSSVDRLMENIRKRDRTFERNIQRSYIEQLNEAYNHFFFAYKSTPLLIVNTNEIDFINNKEDLENLIQLIFREDRAYIEYYSPKPKGLL